MDVDNWAQACPNTSLLLFLPLSRCDAKGVNLELRALPNYHENHMQLLAAIICGYLLNELTPTYMQPLPCMQQASGDRYMAKQLLILSIQAQSISAQRPPISAALTSKQKLIELRSREAGLI